MTSAPGIPDVYTKPTVCTSTLQAKEHCKASLRMRKVANRSYTCAASPKRGPLRIRVGAVDAFLVIQVFPLNELLQDLACDDLIHGHERGSL